MTFTQFARLKPKYKLRITLVFAALAAALVLLVYLLSLGVKFLRVGMNTKKLPDITAANVLDKTSMNEILAVIKQDNADNILVLDSSVTMKNDGTVTSLTMHLLHLPDTSMAETWSLTATQKKSILRKESTVYENLNSRKLRKLPFSTYYPALSRINSNGLLDYLKNFAPSGDDGLYTFTDSFENNFDPAFSSYLERGLDGIWVSSLGAVSTISKDYSLPSKCAPTIVSVSQTESKKVLLSTKKVLADPVDKLVVLLEAAPY